MYTSARQGILSGGIRWMTDDIMVMLLSTGYVFDESHVRLADVAEFAMGSAGPLTEKTPTDGVARAADIDVEASVSRPMGGAVLYRSGYGDPLVAFLESDQPEFVPQAGQMIRLTWSNGPNRIFRI